MAVTWSAVADLSGGGGAHDARQVDEGEVGQVRGRHLHHDRVAAHQARHGIHDTANQHLNLPPLAEYAETIGHLSAIRELYLESRLGSPPVTVSMRRLMALVSSDGDPTSTAPGPLLLPALQGSFMQAMSRRLTVPACLPAMEERGPLSPTYLLGGPPPPPPPLTQWM